MAKEEKELQPMAPSQQEAPDVPPAPAEESPVEERPNRKSFSGRFSKRHPDIDFEDKEARYGAMNDDADRLSAYEENGTALSKLLDSNKWIAAMMLDCSKKGMHPLEWMASQGIDIKAALDDEKVSAKVAEQISKFQENQAEQSKHKQEVDDNIQKSIESLDSLGLSDDEFNDLWKKVWAVIGDAENGTISKETWQLFKKGYGYDNDIASAREESAMQARNEKIQNKVRSSESEGIPPSLSTGSAGNSPVKPRRQTSSFFDDIRSN